MRNTWVRLCFYNSCTIISSKFAQTCLQVLEMKKKLRGHVMVVGVLLFFVTLNYF